MYSLIVPTYNEAKNIPLLLQEIFSLDDRAPAEVIIVDDNSPDGTAAVAQSLASQYPVRVVVRTGKFGLGSAVRAGFEQAAQPIVGVMDADLSHDARILPSLLEALADHDIAVGSRFLAESHVDAWPWWRRAISNLGVWLGKKMTKQPVEDPLSGFFVLHKRVIDGVPLATDGYKILFEILCRGNYDTVKEIPFHFRKREHSQSKLTWQEHWLFLKQLITYWK